MTPVECPVCGNDHFLIFEEGKFLTFKCAQCGVFWASVPKPTVKEVETRRIKM